MCCCFKNWDKVCDMITLLLWTGTFSAPLLYQFWIFKSIHHFSPKTFTTSSADPHFQSLMDEKQSVCLNNSVRSRTFWSHPQVENVSPLGLGSSDNSTPEVTHLRYVLEHWAGAISRGFPPNVVVCNDLQLSEVESVWRDGRPVQSGTNTAENMRPTSSSPHALGHYVLRSGWTRDVSASWICPVLPSYPQGLELNVFCTQWRDLGSSSVHTLW